MRTTTTTETTDYFVTTQAVTPAWQRAVVAQADSTDSDVEVTRQVTPFGTYVVDVRVATNVPTS